MTMALGEAFIDVIANLRPFIRSTKKAMEDAAKEAEDNFKKGLENAAGEGGEKAGRRAAQGVRRTLGDRNKPPWIDITGALAGALDDGISALPAEVKAGIVLGITAALPIAGGALTGALVAAAGIGVAGIGVALASQFEGVQETATREFREIRTNLVESAGAFEDATISAIIRISDEIQLLGPRFERIFNEAASFVAPLNEGLLAALDFITESIERSIGDIRPFVDEIASGFVLLGTVAGDALEILVSTGEDGQAALRDLIGIMAALILGTAELLKLLTETYGLVRDIAQGTPDWLLLLSPGVAAFAGLANETDRLRTENEELINSNVYLYDSQGRVITITKEEEKELKELQKQLEETRDATFDAFQSNIDFERSLDEVAEALKRNGATLDVQNEKGRKNLEEIKAAIQDAQAAALDRFRTQELTAVESAQFYADEINRLREVARQGGITKERFNQIFGALINLNNLPITPETQGLRELAAVALRAAQQLERTLRAARQLRNTGVRMPWGGGFEEFADGDIVNRPTFAMIGEAGPEVVLPLTRPQRAAELMRRSGLDQMLGSNRSGDVYVFIGNEQLDARTYRIVEGSNKAQGLALSQGFRGF